MSAKKLSFSISILLFLLLAGCSSFQPTDLSGYWVGKFIRPDGYQIPFTTALTQGGNLVSGTMNIGGTANGAVSGTVSGNGFSLMSQDQTLQLTGSIQGNSMSGDAVASVGGQSIALSFQANR
jgi:hypothetical protein